MENKEIKNSEEKRSTSIFLKAFATVIGLVTWLLVFVVVSFVVDLIVSVPLLRQILFIQDAPFVTILASVCAAGIAGIFVSLRLCGGAKILCAILAVLQGIMTILWVISIFVDGFSWYTISMIGGWGVGVYLAVRFFLTNGDGI